MFKTYLQTLMSKDILKEEAAYEAMKCILQGQATEAQISSFISILTFRGVHARELTGLTKAMRDHALRAVVDLDVPFIDTCGTGGDGIGTFNISTASAIVVSSGGVPVAKHGNRSVSSLSGSADVLEELAIPIAEQPQEFAQTLKEKKLSFMFAPAYHQAMKHAAIPRKEIGFRSIFNILGPLTNPAGAPRQLIGVFDRRYSVTMAETLKELDSTHVMIVNGENGLDELSISGKTFVTELKDGRIGTYEITPEEVGLVRYALKDIQVNNAQESAQIILDVLTGRNKGAAYEIILFNAGAALYVGRQAETLAEGVLLAKRLIDQGTAYHHYLQLTNNRGERMHA